MTRAIFSISMALAILVAAFGAGADQQWSRALGAGEVRFTVKPADAGAPAAGLAEAPPDEAPVPAVPAVPVEGVETYDRSGAAPMHICSRVNHPEALTFDVAAGGGSECSLYYWAAEASSPVEAGLCALGEDPQNAAGIRSAPWTFVSDVEAGKRVAVWIDAPATLLTLIACADGVYTLVGPAAFNQDPPCSGCKSKAVPAVGRWGLLALAVLLVGCALGYLRRRRTHRA